jgi:uncharacterized protein YdeI (YjbR/CyaY-like superfamily)
MSLRRDVQDVPADVERLLEESGLMAAYLDRPAYQRNDYLGWFARVRQPATRQRRIDQMLAELREGGLYMGMDHPPSRRP